MKYQILPRSPLFAPLQELRAKMAEAHAVVQRVAEELGARGYIVGQGFLVGRPWYFDFDGVEPAGVWRWVPHRRQQGYWAPRRCRANKVLIDRLADLPTVSLEELNRIVGIRGFQYFDDGDGIGMFQGPDMAWGKYYILMSIPEDVKYKPKEGIQLITVAEYRHLLEALKSNAKGLVKNGHA